jgi:CHAD domain-containing protein
MVQDQPEPRSTSVRFLPGETLSEALGRVTGIQFDIALQVVQLDSAHQAAAVHETRKAIKRLRAMLRLVRDSISLDCYHTDNAMLKLIAAELGAVRDSWVMAQILDRLLPQEGDTSGAIPVLVDRLQARYRIESAAVLENKALMASIVEQLEHVRDRAERWTVVAGEKSQPLPHEFRVVAPGLQRVYKRGRRGMRIVAGSPTDTLLHVWRKRAKYLRHQVEALNILDPENLVALEADLERLTDLLGDDHDLAVLLGRLDDDPALVEDIDPTGVFDLIYAERRDLQAEAIAVGERLFEQPSTEFLTYMERIWGDSSSF